MKFIPSIIAKDKKELGERLCRVINLSNEFHLDIMDSKFVKNESLNFKFELVENKKYTAHLMIEKPFLWIKRNYGYYNEFIVHNEAINNKFFEIFEYLNSKKKKLGIAINPKTRVNEIKEYLPFVSQVTIMTVTPGKYGSIFLKNNLKKVLEIRKLNSKVKIQLDGGINEKTISLVPKEVDSVVLGSYLQNSDYPKEAIKLLKEIIQ